MHRLGAAVGTGAGFGAGNTGAIHRDQRHERPRWQVLDQHLLQDVSSSPEINLLTFSLSLSNIRMKKNGSSISRKPEKCSHSFMWLSVPL
jgi:hypothetical protein